MVIMRGMSKAASSNAPPRDVCERTVERFTIELQEPFGCTDELVSLNRNCCMRCSVRLKSTTSNGPLGMEEKYQKSIPSVWGSWRSTSVMELVGVEPSGAAKS